MHPLASARRWPAPSGGPRGMARSGRGAPLLGPHCNSSNNSSSSSSNPRRPPARWRRAAAVAGAGADGAPAKTFFDAARLLSSAAYTAPPLAVGPVRPERASGRGGGLRLVATAPLRPGDLLMATRALAAVFGRASTVSAAGAPSNADLIELLAGRDYSPGELEWLRVVAPPPLPPPKARRRGGGEGKGGEQEGDEDDADADADGRARHEAAWQAARLDLARRLFAAAAAGAEQDDDSSNISTASSSSSDNVPCPLSRDELEELVSRAALAEPSEDAAAAALRAADAASSSSSPPAAASFPSPPPAVATAASAASVTALWPPFALANHSCAPTASVAVFGPVLVLRAAEAMLPGDEVTVCYLGEGRFAPVARRRAALRRSHGFHCQCRRCLAEQRVFPTAYYPQDDVLLGMADGVEEEEQDDEGGSTKEAETAAAAAAADAAAGASASGKAAAKQHQPRLFFPRRSLPARALGWAAALATGRGASAAARAWRAGAPPPPRPAPDHRCLEAAWSAATRSLAEDVRAARTSTVRAAGRREDAARLVDAARARLDAGLEWAGTHAVPRRARRPRRAPRGLLLSAPTRTAAEQEGDAGNAERPPDEDGGDDTTDYDDDVDMDTAVPPEAAGWFAACGMPLHRADAELSRLTASAAVEMESGDFFSGGGKDEDNDADAPPPGDRERLTPLEDDLRARRGLVALRAAQRRRLAALGRCLSAAEAVARGSELHCALAVEHASVARIVAARAGAEGEGDGGDGGDGRERARAAAEARALAADLRSARAHRERYGPPSECPPQLIARLLTARRRAVAGAGLADRMGALAWGDALARDRYSAAAASGARLRAGGAAASRGGGGGGGSGGASSPRPPPSLADMASDPADGSSGSGASRR